MLECCRRDVTARVVSAPAVAAADDVEFEVATRDVKGELEVLGGVASVVVAVLLLVSTVSRDLRNLKHATGSAEALRVHNWQAWRHERGGVVGAWWSRCWSFEHAA